MGIPDLNNELGSIITIISALTAAVVSILNAFKASTTHRKVDEVTRQVNEVESNTKTVMQQTNGDRDRLMTEIAKRDATILKKDAELLRYNKRSTDYPDHPDNDPKE